jgi:transcriptional regulator with XRE-family HTH domain
MRNPLIQFREACGLTATDTALLLNVPLPEVSQVERGVRRPSRRMLERLAALGQDPAAFAAAWRAFARMRRAAIERRVNGKAEGRA